MVIRRLIVALVLAVLCRVGGVEAATWNLVESASCTGINTATVASQASSSVPCCTASGQGACVTREAFGSHWRVSNVDLVATGSYTAGGDVLFSAATLGVLGLSRILSAECTADTGVAAPLGRWAYPIRTDASTAYKLVLSSAGSGGAAPVEASGSIAGFTAHCTLFGL